MSITTNLFMHDTSIISIKKCKAGEDGKGQAHGLWDIVIKDKDGRSIKVLCWGDDAELEINTTGEDD